LKAIKTFTKRLVIFLIFFLTINFGSDAQRFLGLDKGGREKRIRFYPGDLITFKTRESTHFVSGRIDNIGDSVTIGGIKYAVSDFRRIKVYRGNAIELLLLSGAVNLPAAAALFLTAEAVSSQLHKDYPLVEPKHLELSGGLILGGFLMYKLSYRNFRIGKNHPLRIFDLAIK